MPKTSAGISTFDSTVRQGRSTGDWNMKPTRRDGSITTSPAIDTVPVLGSRRPATMLRKVDFPHPLRPTKETNSPRAIEMSTPSSALTTVCSRRNSLEMPRASMIGAVEAVARPAGRASSVLLPGLNITASNPALRLDLLDRSPVELVHLLEERGIHDLVQV